MYWVVIGTRPEMIKLAPVIKELDVRGEDANVILTGQHPAVAKLARQFGIKHKTNLHINGRHLNNIVMDVMAGLDGELKKRPSIDCMIVQGDTTSAMAAALWAFNKKIPVAHVEAGLRTYGTDPYPEESNRRIISAVATYHYAPTERAFENLMVERYDNAQMVGNTVVDALKLVPSSGMRYHPSPYALLTLHRRESWGDPMIDTLQGVMNWLKTTDMKVVWPVHPNKAVTKIAAKFNHPQLTKMDPLYYVDFIQAMLECRFIVTDSGGVQEEATTLGKYTIVVRGETERPEAISAGTARLVLPKRANIRRALQVAERDWQDVEPSDVFGDGHAAERIVEHLLS
jgi:UDP-N-acetylglucosamine 2-epimerase (non-hydrolysing)